MDEAKDIVKRIQGLNPVTAATIAAANARRMTMNTQKSQNRRVLVPIRATKQPGRNDPCTCGSGIKYKKCCLTAQQGRVRDPSKLPKLKIDQATVNAVVTATTAPASKNATAMAMLRTGIDQRIVWAYLETGIFMTERNKAAHSPETRSRWEKALNDYDNATEAERRIMLAPALPEETNECSDHQLPDQTDSPGSESTSAG